MRFANQDNRLLLIISPVDADLRDATGIDLHRESGGALPAEADRAMEQWSDVLEVAHNITGEGRSGGVPIDPARLGAPSPRPRQIFAIGINYADHGEESGIDRPSVPMVFPKLGPSVTGPYADIALPTAKVDWEAELVVVIGKEAVDVAAGDAWDVVAGVTGGQDLSEREVQWRPSGMPQFSLGKSLPGFGPMGPLLVTPDEFANPDDIELSCALNGEQVQHSRSSLMLFGVSELIAYLSGITTLLPGDAIFTGTPSGVGTTRTPPRYLSAGDQLVSTFEGIGVMSNTFTAVASARPAG